MPDAVEQTLKFGNEAFDTRGGAGKWVLAWGHFQAEALTERALLVTCEWVYATLAGHAGRHSGL